MKALVLVPLGLTLLLALSVTGCGGDEGPLTPEQARDASGEVTVEGSLIAIDGEPVRMCSAILESYPPQCGEPSLEVQGLDLDSLDLASTRPDDEVTPARWSDRPIQVSGTVESGVLVVG
jgi:hypothetical protein